MPVLVPNALRGQTNIVGNCGAYSIIIIVKLQSFPVKGVFSCTTKISSSIVLPYMVYHDHTHVYC